MNQNLRRDLRDLGVFVLAATTLVGAAFALKKGIEYNGGRCMPQTSVLDSRVVWDTDGDKIPDKTSVTIGCRFGVFTYNRQPTAEEIADYKRQL